MSQKLISPAALPAKSFNNSDDAVDYLITLYDSSAQFLSDAFSRYLEGQATLLWPCR